MRWFGRCLGDVVKNGLRLVLDILETPVTVTPNRKFQKLERFRVFGRSFFSVAGGGGGLGLCGSGGPVGDVVNKEGEKCHKSK